MCGIIGILSKGDVAPRLLLGLRRLEYRGYDSSGIAENTYVILNSESIYVDKKDGNKLFVKRGQDQTLPTAHVAGTAINLITATTNSLIEVGDNFGFDGSLT